MGIDKANSGSPFESKGTYRTDSNNKAKPIAAEPVDITEAKAKTNSLLNFSLKTSTDQKQATESGRLAADARGHDELNHWGALGAGALAQETNHDDSAIAVIDKLRSISDKAIERSTTYSTYKNLFALSQESGLKTDVELNS